MELFPFPFLFGPVFARITFISTTFTDYFKVVVLTSLLALFAKGRTISFVVAFTTVLTIPNGAQGSSSALALAAEFISTPSYRIIGHGCPNSQQLSLLYF